MPESSERVPAVFEVVEASTLHPHEEVLADRVEAVVRVLQREGVLDVPVVADRKTGVILDGHHRYAALLKLGVRRIPVAFVDYQDQRIRVESWRTGETPPTKEEVIAMALSGRRFPPKSTRHRALSGIESNPARLSDLR